MKSLRNRLCLVTGAASGIGRATAELLVDEGARLCLTDINRPSLDAVTQELTEKGGRVLFHRALDVSDPYAVQAFADDIHKQHGCVDVVMNIAGISTWGTIENLELTHWNQFIRAGSYHPRAFATDDQGWQGRSPGQCVLRRGSVRLALARRL